MAEDSGEARDLFGDPWTPPRDPRGRKRHRRLPQVAEKVAVLRAAGLKETAIALRIGLSEPTLRKYYFRELAEGETLARAVLIEGLWAEAKTGKAAAARIILEEFDKGRAAVPVSRRDPSKVEKLGKKAQADADAKTAQEGTSWADLLPH
jgi:hypothetical protein